MQWLHGEHHLNSETPVLFRNRLQKKQMSNDPSQMHSYRQLGPVDIHFNQRQMAATSTKDKYDEANLS